MADVKRTGKIRVDQLATLGEPAEDRLLAAIVLLALQLSDSLADKVRAIGRPPVGNLCVERCQLAVVKPDNRVASHPDIPPSDVSFGRVTSRSAE